jgi:hypothetical protein
MLKYELENLEGVDDTLKPMYEEKGGKFVLKVDGIPALAGNPDADKELSALRRNNAKLLEEQRAAKEAAEAARIEAAKKGGDVEALEKSWSEKMQAALAEKDSELGQFKQMVTGLTVGATAATFAAEVFGDHAELMMPHVNSRLSTEIVDGRARVRVLDANGQPSAMSVDDLKSEFRNNAKYAAFVVASRASGGGPRGTGGGAGSATMTRSAFDQLPPRSRSEFMAKGGTLTEG